jgi:hypothetical protein
MTMGRDSALMRSEQAVTIGDLFKLALAPPIRWLRRRMRGGRIQVLQTISIGGMGANPLS